MKTDLSTLNLKQPDQIDWNNFNPQSSYQAPPPVEDATGKRIVYTGTLPKELTFDGTNEGYLQAHLDPIVLQGPNGAGQQLRFTKVNVKAFTKNGKVLNVSSFGKFLRAAGSKATPMTNEQYTLAAQQVAGKPVKFTIDWEAYNKDTQENIKGYRAFPEDPQRPGQRRTILHAGDVYNLLDNKGNVIGQDTVKSEIIFANARIKNFIDGEAK
jgi:hypothetical protein